MIKLGNNPEEKIFKEKLMADDDNNANDVDKWWEKAIMPFWSGELKKIGH